MDRLKRVQQRRLTTRVMSSGCSPQHHLYRVCRPSEECLPRVIANLLRMKVNVKMYRMSACHTTYLHVSQADSGDACEHQLKATETVRPLVLTQGLAGRASPLYLAIAYRYSPWPCEVRRNKHV